jgi:hypothetical protein
MAVSLGANQPSTIKAAVGAAIAIVLVGNVPSGATLSLAGQGTDGTDNTAIPAVFTSTSCAFTMPDDCATGVLTITSGDTSTVALQLIVVSQYVTSAEYAAAGEGTDLTNFAAGELDNILRRASAYAEAYVGFELRLMPNVKEEHTWRSPSEDNARLNTRVYPVKFPIVSLDQFIVRISEQQYATFPSDDIVINSAQRYVEILSYAVASYTLLGAIQNLGLVANIVELYYTSGYPFANYPAGLKEAVTMIATELISYRGIQVKGFGGLSSVKEGQAVYQRRDEPFAMPAPAKELLRPFMFRRIA